jgi:hypothetical protein
MFNAVSEAQRDAVTVLVFIVTFFVALGIGRFLKRRAGVQLGLLFRLFLFNDRVLCRDCGVWVARSLALSCWCRRRFC